MKRLVLSVVGGLAIPLLYSIIVGPFTPYIKDNSRLDLLAMVPVRWPILLLFQLGMIPFESETAILVYMIACNVALYSLLTYFLLGDSQNERARASLLLQTRRLLFNNEMTHHQGLSEAGRHLKVPALFQGPANTIGKASSRHPNRINQ